MLLRPGSCCWDVTGPVTLTGERRTTRDASLADNSSPSKSQAKESPPTQATPWHPEPGCCLERDVVVPINAADRRGRAASGPGLCCMSTDPTRDDHRDNLSHHTHTYTRHAQAAMFGKKKLTPKEQSRELKKEIRHNEVCGVLGGGGSVGHWVNRETAPRPAPCCWRIDPMHGRGVVWPPYHASVDRTHNTQMTCGRSKQAASRRPIRPQTVINKQRDLERELWNLDREEQKLIAEIKKEAGKGASQKALKTLAGNLVQVRAVDCRCRMRWRDWIG